MILTDREIQIALQRKQIIIDRLPQVDTAYSSTSVDLTLDPIITLFDTGKKFVKKVIDPTHQDYNIMRLLEKSPGKKGLIFQRASISNQKNCYLVGPPNT